jgi:hypothetical protein
METIGKKTGLETRKLLIYMARPEGFEPPTPRSVELPRISLTIVSDPRLDLKHDNSITYTPN